MLMFRMFCSSGATPSPPGVAVGFPVVEPVGPPRFAFHGRLSTKEHQDSNTFQRWQLK
jgi:hypothetical protein